MSSSQERLEEALGAHPLNKWHPDRAAAESDYCKERWGKMTNFVLEKIGIRKKQPEQPELRGWELVPSELPTNADGLTRYIIAGSDSTPIGVVFVDEHAHPGRVVAEASLDGLPVNGNMPPVDYKVTLLAKKQQEWLGDVGKTNLAEVATKSLFELSEMNKESING